MELLIFIAVVAAIWWWVKKNKKSTNSPATQQPPRSASPNGTPEIKFTITTSTGMGEYSGGNSELQDLGPLTPVGPQTWRLNPKASFPLTLMGADESVARQIKHLASKDDHWSHKVPEFALLVAQHNLRFKEVDDFIAEQKPKFDAAVAQKIKDAPEWSNASEKDRHDMQAEYQEVALEGLGLSIGDAELKALFLSQPSDFTSDDEILSSFGGDSALYSFYLTQLGRTNSVATVKADDWSRKSWEQLVERGRARRGKDIPIAMLLEGLRLKDLNELLAGTIEKPLGRKAKALEAAEALPDLQARLSERISFREMFQILPPVGLDIDELRSSFGHARVVATAVLQTYYTAAKTQGTVASRNEDREFYKGWEVTTWIDPMPVCAQAYCKKYQRLPSKLPPFHLGCNCRLERTYKD